MHLCLGRRVMHVVKFLLAVQDSTVRPVAVWEFQRLEGSYASKC